MIFAVSHGNGVSLYDAVDGQQALDSARYDLGSINAPYRIGAPKDVDWAQAMGARVNSCSCLAKEDGEHE